MSKQKVVKGYKVFNPDWTCRGFQYQVGKYYEIPEKPVVCERGFHFCKNLLDCYEYYRFDENNKVAEVTAYGDINIDEYEKKYCTNKIKIEKELNWNEVLNMVNTGKNCTGFRNTGDRNTGNWNTGCFNTVEQKIFLFNKLSDWTMKDWINSEARSIFYDIRISPVQKINKKDMTEKEKEQHPEYQTTGFYLKELRSEEIAEERQKYWNQLSQKQKDIVMAIPNFDKEIFKEITGIDVDKGVMKHEERV